MARFWCVLLCAVISAVLAFLVVLQTNAKRDNLSKSTVRVTVGQGHGSGVNIGGFVISAAHVVGSESEVMLSTSDGKQTPADVLWVNRAHDVALLKPREKLTAAVSRLACDAPVSVGQSIEAVGNPGPLEFVHSWGRVSGPTKEYFRWKLAFIADLGIAPGSSGGPVLDHHGRVVGIVVGVILTQLGWTPAPTHYALIVPASAICSLLARPRNSA